MSYSATLYYDLLFSVYFQDPIVVACRDAELIDVSIPQLWTRANYYNATHYEFPEIEDTGSIILGDSTGVSYCGERSYTLLGGSSFLLQGSSNERQLTLYTTSESNVGYHSDVYMLVELVDWSISSNQTLSVQIPILIESCIPTGIAYASGQK